MTQIASDDILEGLYKLWIRESEKLKTVLELYNTEIHQKKAGPDYHRLKTIVKRSMEHNLRIKNFETRKRKLWYKRRSSNYSECNIDDKWSSQECKSGETLGAWTRRPIDDKFVIDDDMDFDTVTESNLSLKSRSFLNRVNDRVRKMLDQSSKAATQDSNEHSLIWRMFVSSTLQASVFMGKNDSENQHSIKKPGIISQWNRCLTNLKSS